MSEQDEGTKYIVRIAGRDLNGALPISRALTGIKGVGVTMAKNIAIIFEKETGVKFETPVGTLSEEQEKKLEEILLAPQKFAIPAWSLNRQREYDSGENLHLIGNDLDFSQRQGFTRLNEIKSYRGLRLSWGLTVRGQRTRSTHRGKGPVVGVMKKDAKQAIAPKKEGSAAPAAGKPSPGKPAAGKKEGKK